MRSGSIVGKCSLPVLKRIADPAFNNIATAIHLFSLLRRNIALSPRKLTGRAPERLIGIAGRIGAT
jgi:hypothetical protein